MVLSFHVVDLLYVYHDIKRYVVMALMNSLMMTIIMMMIIITIYAYI